MLKKGNSLRFLWLFIIVLNPNVKIQAQDTALQDALLTAFANKDAARLHPFLSPNFTVGVYNRPIATKMLQTVVERYPLDSLKIEKAESLGEKKKITLTVFSKGKPAVSYAYLDNENKILFVDFFDRLYGVDKNQHSELKARFPFQMIDGAIVVTARINHSSRPLKLLFDTGADGLALNKKLADSLGLVTSHEQNASVVGGKMNISISSGNTLHLDTLSLPGNNIGIFENIGWGLDGILGNTIAKKYITKVDFDKQVIELYNFGDYEFEKDGITIDTRLPGGVPLIPASVLVGEKEATGNFVFDTGAGYYVIGFGPFVKTNLLLVKGFVPYYGGSTVSMGHSTASFTGNFSKLDMGKLGLVNLPGVLQAYTPGISSPGDVSGSIGIKTWRRFNFTLNLARQTIHLTPNKNYTLPYDFVLRDLYLSFNNKNQLLVEQVIKEGNAGSFLVGDIIYSVNGIKVEDMIHNPGKIKRLQDVTAIQQLKIELVRNGTHRQEIL